MPPTKRNLRNHTTHVNSSRISRVKAVPNGCQQLDYTYIEGQSIEAPEFTVRADNQAASLVQFQQDLASPDSNVLLLLLLHDGDNTSEERKGKYFWFNATMYLSCHHPTIFRQQNDLRILRRPKPFSLRANRCSDHQNSPK